MLNIMKLFGRSPFAPLKTHMEKVAGCVAKVKELFGALEKEDYATVETVAQQISVLEHEADLIKNNIRNHLPKGLFLPVDRGDLLELLSIQDSIADKSEDISVLLGFKKLVLLDVFKKDFQDFLAKNIEAFDRAHEIIDEMEDLLESSFGGSEADRVRTMVDKVAYLEHQADIIQRKLLKDLFAQEQVLGYASFFLWQKVFESVAAISNSSERLANRVRMMLELK